MISLYNTLTHKKEPLPKTDHNSPLRLFVCGPTVYDYQHVGNFRTFMFFDLLVRYMRSQDISVTYLQNITDIDDKILERAKELKKDWKELSNFHTEAFLSFLEQFGITSIDANRKATDHIPELVAQAQKLIEKDIVYKIEGDGWYFDISKFEDYGKLARRTVEAAEDGVSRIDHSPDKRNKGDFAVWKFSKEGEPTWKTELGDGRPGWHIEDTAITEKYFGEQYDLHGGGTDLMFPHHEAEIAIQESISGKKPFVKLWLHTEMMLSGGVKMSKSKGNFLTGKDFLAKHPAELLRMMSLTTHYRSTLEYTEETVHAATKHMADIRATLARLLFVLNTKHHIKTPHTIALKDYEDDLHAALNDDFNTPKAMAVLFGLLGEVNENLFSLSSSSAEHVRTFLLKTFTMFGFTELEVVVPDEVLKLAAERELFRNDQQFAQSDELREKIDALGYVVEDTPHGPLVLPK